MSRQNSVTSLPDDRRSFIEHLDAETTPEGNAFVATFHDLSLRSVFQPIFSVAHRRAVGYEALLRASRKDGQAVSPPLVFATAKSDEEGIHVDRLSRLLHVKNYQRFGVTDNWLFLNVNALSISSRQTQEPFVGRLLQYFGLEGHQIAIEILEGAIRNQSSLLDAVNYYRGHGCLVAIDAGHSNFDRIWHLSPDFVKLDRSLIQQSTLNRRVRKMLPHLVSLLHEIGALVVMEGIETEEEGLIALDSDVDLVQGFLFGRPDPHIPAVSAQGIAALCTRFRTTVPGVVLNATASYQNAFSGVIDALVQGVDIARACERLVAHARVLRCYLLDGQGNQVGSNYVSSVRCARNDVRFMPLADTAGANWSRRPYFRRALAHPDETQLTRPYFSIPDAGICVTMSCTYALSGTLFVFCCDMEPEETV